MAQYRHKERHTDQWKRIGNPEINPHISGQVSFDRGAKKIQWVKDSIFNNHAGKIGYPPEKE